MSDGPDLGLEWQMAMRGNEGGAEEEGHRDAPATKR